MMIKEWYININGNEEGPYHSEDLKEHPHVTADTLVWKNGFTRWVPLHKIKELHDVLKHKLGGKPQRKPDETEPKEREKRELPSRITPEGIVMEMRSDPPPTLFWILVFIILFFYIIRLYWH